MISIDAQPQLHVRAWADPVVDRYGFAAHSEYVERFWTPLIGPSTLFLLRFLVSRLHEVPGGFVMPCARTAQFLGLSDKTGPDDIFPRTVNRLIQFRLAYEADDVLFVRRNIASLHPKQVQRLSSALQVTHQDFLRDQVVRTDLTATPTSPVQVEQPQVS